MQSKRGLSKMRKILETYKILYHQIIDDLAKNNISSEERRLLIVMLYNTEINIQQANNVLNKQ